MLDNFIHEQASSIVFGIGERRQLPSVIEQFGTRLLLIAGTKSFTSSGHDRELLSLLSSFDILHLTCPPGEPTADGLENLLREARRYQPTVILGVGGGSVLDMAKALSGLIPSTGAVESFLDGSSQITEPCVPWVAVPTTAGTGSEVTKNAVIKSGVLGVKRSIRSPLLISACAVVDPELTMSCPKRITGIAGLDALSQLVESYVSIKAKPITRSMIVGAFPGMLLALKKLPENLEDPEARKHAAYGSLVSGIALANSGLGAAHGFASALGGMYDIPHGLICGVLLKPVLSANKELIRADCVTLTRDIRVIAEKPDPVEWLKSEITSILSLFGIPDNLKSYGIHKKDIETVARNSSGSSMSGNPRELSLEERIQIITSVL